MTDTAAGSDALAVEYRTVGSLKPDPRNARTHPKRQIEQIKASIKEFGFTNPILIDEQGAIIAGHGRLRAANGAGLAEVPTIVLAGLTDGQKRALRLADNKIALGASWDLDLLKLELGDLADMDFDLGLTGFSAGEIDIALLGANDPDDDHLPEIRTAPRTRPDDIWLLGDHRLGCGDGRDRAFLRRVIGERREDRRCLSRLALQCRDRRACQHARAPPRVRDGLRRDERGRVPNVPHRRLGGVRRRIP